MIITKIIGGIGNQMFQYAIGRALSIKYGVSLKLDISSFKNYKLHNGFRLNHFCMEKNIANDMQIESLSGKNNIFYKVLKRLTILKYSSYYKEKHSFVYDKDIFNGDDIYLDGYWQNERYFKDIRDILLKDFSINYDLKYNINQYINTIKSQNSISIHVRRGDYIKLRRKYNVLDINYYKKSCEIILDNIHNPVFYIFSDDMNWCKNNFTFIKDKVFVDNTNSEIEDLELMKNCKHNIIANSTFSWWGAWLNEKEDKNVIAPKRWFNDQKINKKSIDMSCKNCIKV